MEIRHAIEIDCAPEALWPWLVEPELQKQWMHGVESNETVEGDGRSVGSKFKMVIKEGRKSVEYVGTVTTYDEPRVLAVSLVGGCGKEPMTMHATYTLTRLAERRCRLAYVGGGEVQGVLFTLFGWLMKLMGKAFVKKFFRSLKACAEKGVPAATSAA